MIERKPPGAPDTVIVEPGETVLIGRGACVRQPLEKTRRITIDLRCSMSQGRSPITYTWGQIEGDNSTEITSGTDDPVILTVKAPGSYFCMVENSDGEDVRISDVFGKEESLFAVFLVKQYHFMDLPWTVRVNTVCTHCRSILLG